MCFNKNVKNQKSSHCLNLLTFSKRVKLWYHVTDLCISKTFNLPHWGFGQQLLWLIKFKGGPSLCVRREIQKIKFSDNTMSQQQRLDLTVTDLRVMPWKVPMVSILKLSVSEGKQDKPDKFQVTGRTKLFFRCRHSKSQQATKSFRYAHLKTTLNRTTLVLFILIH